MPKMTTNQIHQEFTVFVDRDIGGKIFPIPLCALCGNTGIIKASWGWDGKGKEEIHRIKTFCICLNGRARKKQAIGGPRWGSNSVIKHEVAEIIRGDTHGR